MDNLTHNDRIEAAIADLKSQSRLNIAKTGRKWGIARETLSKRYRGETGTKEEATSNSRKALTDMQEDALIRYINMLSARGLPPTPQIIKNLAEEIVNTKLDLN